MAAVDNEIREAGDRAGLTRSDRNASFRRSILAEARRHLDETWVKYIVLPIDLAPNVIIMGRSRAEAVAAFIDFLETRRARAPSEHDIPWWEPRTETDPGMYNIDDFFEYAYRTPWLFALPEGPPVEHFVPELRPLRTKSADKM